MCFLNSGLSGVANVYIIFTLFILVDEIAVS